jgi:hypothetical protein
MTKHRVVRTGLAVAAGIAMGLATASFPALAGVNAPASYSFRKLDNNADPNYNELLGINDHDHIVGFYGSGAQGSPWRGYELVPPYGQGDYHAIRFPGSAQTVAAGINDNGVVVGYFSNTNKANPGLNGRVGFYVKNGYHKVAFPTGNNSNPPFNELLGINNGGVAVGDFADSAGNVHAYRYNINTHRFSRINIQGSSYVVATGINAGGTVVGYFVNGSGQTVGFLRRSGGQVVTFGRPSAVETQAFGINAGGEVVGTYTSSSGTTFGFTWVGSRGFRTVNDPAGSGTTFTNGINEVGYLVGFYVDSLGNTDGMLAVP